MNISLIIRAVMFAVILLLIGFAYIKGGNDENAKMEALLKDNKITVLKDGQKIDTTVDTGDDNFLCTVLGGC